MVKKQTIKYILLHNIFFNIMPKLDKFTIVALVAALISALLLLFRFTGHLHWSNELVEMLRNISTALVVAAIYRNLPPKNLQIGLFLLSLLVAIVFSFWGKVLPIPPFFVSAARWVVLGGVIFYALQKSTLTTWIFVSMLIGIEIGYDHAPVALELQVLSKIFIKLIKTIVAPLIFGTLVVGIAGHANIKQVGRMGWKSLLYFEIVTTIALFIGWGAINLSQAGVGIKAPTETSASTQKTLEEAKANAQKQKSDHTQLILDVFPDNIAKAVYDGKVLQIVIFSVLFGIALSMLSEEKRAPMIHFAESLSEGMFKFTNIIMYYAPIGVGAAIAVTVAHMGLDVLLYLVKLLATLYLALAVLILGVLLPVALIIKLPIKRFLQTIAEPVSIAFATTSSDAALPKAMEKLAEFGIPKKIIAFVLPTGYTFNLDGTTLYLSLASIFVAQAAGIEMTTGQQLTMLFTLMLTSKGVAAVPRASLVILFGTASSFGLPEWPIYLILGIDELMDMARTAVNIMGNCLATVVIAKWEGEWQPEVVGNKE